jgi:hypothetical protein
MVFPVGKELLFGCVRKGQVSEVVEECREPNYLSPCHQGFGIGEDVDGAISIAFVSDDVEDAAGEFHDSERVLESPMCRSWVDEVCQRKLVNVAKPLKRP